MEITLEKKMFYGLKESKMKEMAVRITRNSTRKIGVFFWQILSYCAKILIYGNICGHV